MNAYVGEIAGLAAAVFWSMSAIAWGHAGRRVGAFATCSIRLAMALVMLCAIRAVTQGGVWPLHANTRSLLLLAISGVCGAGIGDLFYIRSISLVGPRLSMLLTTTAPAMAALMAALPPMHERLGAAAWAGMALTLAGVGWAVLENPDHRAWAVPKGAFWPGVFCGLAGSVFLAVGFVLTRAGLSGVQPGGLDPLSGTQVRVAAAAAFSWLSLPFMSRLGSTLRAFLDRRAMAIIVAGTVVGPVIGIWLSLVALDRLETGVASTLISAGPAIAIIPLAYLSHREKPTWRGVTGACIAVAGVALLVARHRL